MQIRLLNAQTELIDPQQLALAEINPRRGDVDALCESFRANGFWGSVIVDRRNGRVLAGNHRVMAARKLGMERVPVQWVDVDSDVHALCVMLADNKHSDDSSYDDVMLSQLLRAANNLGVLPATGYRESDLSSLLAGLQGEDDGHTAVEKMQDGCEVCPKCMRPM